MSNLLIEIKIKEISDTLYGVTSKVQRTNIAIDIIKQELKKNSKKEFVNYYTDLAFVLEILISYQKTRFTIPLTDPKHLLESKYSANNENEKKRQTFIINLLNSVIFNHKQLSK